MKYKSIDYAKALVSLVTSEKDLNDKKVSDAFLKVLAKDKNSRKAKEIIKIAQDLYIKKIGKNKILLETARPISEKQRELVKDITSKGDIVEEKISPEMIAGIKITINNEKQLDFTIAKKIQNIFN